MASEKKMGATDDGGVAMRRKAGGDKLRPYKGKGEGASTSYLARGVDAESAAAVEEA